MQDFITDNSSQFFHLRQLENLPNQQVWPFTKVKHNISELTVAADSAI
jgi:hypothetical protein